MPYNLVYDRNGKRISITYSSFYEFVCKKNKLRAKGIEFKEKTTGGDVWREISPPTRQQDGAKIAIKRFLEMANGIRDYRNEKRIKDGRTDRKSSKVGERARNKQSQVAGLQNGGRVRRNPRRNEPQSLRRRV